MSTLLARKGYAQVQSTNALAEAWQQAVGAPLKTLTRANKVTGGTLEVTVGNSSVLHELTFQQQALLKEMQRQVPDQTIKQLKFRVGSIG